MRDVRNFDGAECEELEAEIRAMCDSLKLAAPPSDYSLEDAIEKVICGRISPASAKWFPAFTTTVGEFYRSLAAVFTAQRLSYFASSIIVLMMLMIIPLALFSNRSMAMGTQSAQAHSPDRVTQANDEDLKLKCSQYQCGDKRYEK